MVWCARSVVLVHAAFRYDWMKEGRDVVRVFDKNSLSWQTLPEVKLSEYRWYPTQVSCAHAFAGCTLWHTRTHASVLLGVDWLGVDHGRQQAPELCTPPVFSADTQRHVCDSGSASLGVVVLEHVCVAAAVAPQDVYVC